LDAEIAEHLAGLPGMRGKRLGDPGDPLLVSVRSGAKFSMPGMQAVHSLHEQNPMLGLRGVRLGLVVPWLFDLQVRGMAEATAQLIKRGRTLSRRS
jgi:PEP-utilising enzyme, PEP-binding domain